VRVGRDACLSASARDAAQKAVIAAHPDRRSHRIEA